jgi:hypothetical protein
VLGPRGEAVSGALVEASWRTGNARAPSDGAGRFRLVGVPPGPVSLRVRNPDFEDATWPYLPASLEVSEGDDVTVRLEEGVAIEGEVVDEEGRPVTVGSLWAHPKTEPRFPRDRAGRGAPPTFARATLWGSNRFRVGPVPEGAYLLTYSGERGFANQRMDVTAPARGVRVQVGRAYRLEGRVLGDADGFRVDFRTADGQGAGTNLDASGRFGMNLDRDVPGFLHVRRANDDRYAFAESVVPGSDPVTLRLTVGEPIGGRIEVPPGLKVTGVRAEDGSRRLHVDGTIRPDGTFSIRGLPPGRYTVRAFAGGAVIEAHDVPVGARDVVLRAQRR